MVLELTKDDLDRLTEAATRWQRRATGGKAKRDTASLTLLTAEIGGIVNRLSQREDTARLVWEGKHLHGLLSRVMYKGVRAEF
jgi:hypothetical protein